jgi:hypothetical protein
MTIRRQSYSQFQPALTEVGVISIPNHHPIPLPLPHSEMPFGPIDISLSRIVLSLSAGTYPGKSLQGGAVRGISPVGTPIAPQTPAAAQRY